MPNRLSFAGAAFAAIAALSGPQRASAEGNLVVYCAVQEEWCRNMVTAFERQTGVKVAMTRKSSGEFYAQVQAEATNPRGDIWWGGTGDPHMQAAEEGLTIEYESPNLAKVHDWAKKQWEQSKHRAIGVYAGALGYGYNTDLLQKAGGAEPKCWADLTDARFHDEVQVADPNSSGTAYTLLATVVQLMGEDKGFDYLKRLHRNVNQYTKSGAAPAKATSLGETLIGITFQHDMVTFVVDGAPIKVVAPCEGTGYEIGSMSIIKGARNVDSAEKWYDWALTAEAQKIGGESKSYQVPSNKDAKPPPQAPDFSQIKFIDYDFAKYGSSAERKRLLTKWDNEVKKPTALVAALSMPAVGISALFWLLLGWIGFAILPWYFDEGLLSAPAASGLVLAIADRRFWLLPFGLPLLLGFVPMLWPRSRAAAGNWLVAIGLAGLLWVGLEGFAIDHRGWSAEWIANLFGTMGPRQRGMGYGAFLTLLAFLMLLCHGLAARGICGGDAFTSSALGLILATVGLFVFFPVAKVLASAFEDNAGRLAPASFLVLLLDRSVWGLDCVTSRLSCGVAWNSLFLGLVVAVGATMLGLACALIVTRTSFRFKGTLRALTVLPIITPPFVIGLAIILLFGRAGAVTGLLADWFGLPRSRWIYGWPGVCIAQLLAFAPIAFLVLIGVVDGISPSLEEAAQTLRARRWTIFWTVSWPLMRPGVANAVLLSFVESLADFGNPLVLGGNFEVLSTKIFYAVVGAAHDRARSAVLSIILLGLTLLLFYAQHRWLGRRSYITLTGKGDAGLRARLPRGVKWLCCGLVAPWLLLTIMTYATILLGGFATTMGRDYTPTIRHYWTAFSVEPTATGLLFTGSAWASLLTTVEIATIAAPFTALLGLLTAYLLSRRQFVGRRAFEFATMLSFAIPGTVVGVSYILAFNVPPIELTGTGLILIICFVFRNMPVGVRAGIAAMSQIDRSLDEASLMLRARSATTLRRIIVPLLRPAIAASLVYAFVRAMTSVSAIIFLVSAEYNMATAYIVGRVEAGEFGLAIAYSSILILIMLLAVSLIQLVVGQRRLGRRAIEVGAAPVAAQAAG